MQPIISFKSKLFHINNQNFEEAALELFRFQYLNNSVYRSFVDYLSIDSNQVKSIDQIPFLPIRFFKSHKIISSAFNPDKIFESSGTSMTSTSKHYIEDLDFYRQVSSSAFSSFFGHIQGAIFIGLLPSYLERSNSSLVYMVDQFVKASRRPESGFYLDDHQKLIAQLRQLKRDGSKIYLFGVTFALLELAKKYQIDMNDVVVLETGGMKGRGRELVREELHELLKEAFRGAKISSEYGMTELLSQAYLDESGYFNTPPWMKVMIRDINDPFSYVKNGKSGAINVIDLANIHSCAFIETEDLGMKNTDVFKVLGRLDNSDMRGCNLLIA